MESKRKHSINLGDRLKTKLGDAYTVVRYESHEKVTVKFDATCTVVTCSSRQIHEGYIKDHFKKSVLGKGFYGLGPFNAKVNGKFTPEYQLWSGLMRRIYSEKALKKNPRYASVTLCEDWHNFQIFATWCAGQEGFGKVDHNGKRFQLDKDLLVPNNTVYSASTCCFLPAKINTALKGRQTDKTTELPAGVYPGELAGSYFARIKKQGKNFYLGTFSTVEHAAAAYKVAKDDFLAELAEEFKDSISENVYEALLNFKLESRDNFNRL